MKRQGTCPNVRREVGECADVKQMSVEISRGKNTAVGMQGGNLKACSCSESDVERCAFANKFMRKKGPATWYQSSNIDKKLLECFLSRTKFVPTCRYGSEDRTPDFPNFHSPDLYSAHGEPQWRGRLTIAPNSDQYSSSPEQKPLGAGLAPRRRTHSAPGPCPIFMGVVGPPRAVIADGFAVVFLRGRSAAEDTEVDPRSVSLTLVWIKWSTVYGKRTKNMI